MPDSGSDLARLPREVLEALLERAPVMIAVLDDGGLIVWANREHERALGGTRGALIGRRFADLCAAAEDRTLGSRFLEGLEGGWQPLTLRRADGTVVQTAWSGVRLAAGTIVVVGRDVTEERDLAARLARAERLEAIGRLAGGIAHDFNNLLTVIGGNAQLLVELRELTGPALDEAEEIVRAADTARSVVRQLLTFTGRAPQPARVVDVNERIDHLREIVHRLIDAPIQVEFDLSAGLPPVRLEEGQLEQVVINLLMNARDAMAAGGRVTVRTALAEVGPEGADALSGRVDPGRYVSLSVADTGHGVAPEARQRMLEPFFTTKASAGGTGLGLSTVHAIVQQAGGSLGIDSTPGQGSTFTIYLPAASPEPVAAPERTTVPPPVPPARILVVDEHEAIRALCRRALENDGHEVLDAGTVDAALEAAREAERLDLVILDLRLPGENGRELPGAVRAMQPGVRVLLTSAQRGAASPGAPVLEKPFTAASLVAAVRRVLS